MCWWPLITSVRCRFILSLDLAPRLVHVANVIVVLLAYLTSECSSKLVHPCSLARAVTARTHSK